MIQRFSKKGIRDDVEISTNLSQNSSVAAYRDQFEDLSMVEPVTLFKAFEGAQLQEMSLDCSTRLMRGFSSTGKSRTTSKIASQQQDPLPLAQKPWNPSPPEVVTLSAQVIQERRDLGLCFKCGKKSIHDHRCKMKHASFLLYDKDEERELTESSDFTENGCGPMVEVSLHALFDQLHIKVIQNGEQEQLQGCVNLPALKLIIKKDLKSFRAEKRANDIKAFMRMEVMSTLQGQLFKIFIMIDKVLHVSWDVYVSGFKGGGKGVIPEVGYKDKENSVATFLYCLLFKYEKLLMKFDVGCVGYISIGVFVAGWIEMFGWILTGERQLQRRVHIAELRLVRNKELKGFMAKKLEAEARIYMVVSEASLLTAAVLTIVPNRVQQVIGSYGDSEKCQALFVRLSIDPTTNT